MSPTNHNFSCLHENSWGSAATASVHKFECGRPNQPTDSLKQLKNSGADRKIEGPSFFKANVSKGRALKVTSLIQQAHCFLRHFPGFDSRRFPSLILRCTQYFRIHDEVAESSIWPIMPSICTYSVKKQTEGPDFSRVSGNI